MNEDNVSYELLRRLAGFDGRPKIEACVKISNAVVNMREPQYLDVKLAVDETYKNRAIVRQIIKNYRVWKKVAQGTSSQIYQVSFDILEGTLLKRALQDRLKAYRQTHNLSIRMTRIYLERLPKNGWEKLGSWRQEDESE